MLRRPYLYIFFHPKIIFLSFDVIFVGWQVSGSHLPHLPLQTLTPPSSPESAGAVPTTLRALPAGLVRLAAAGTHPTRSAIIRVTAKGGKMIPRLISFSPATVALKSALSDSQIRLEAALEEKRRIHKCSFPNCKKVYTKSSHLKAHQRTHTGQFYGLFIELFYALLLFTMY